MIITTRILVYFISKIKIKFSDYFWAQYYEALNNFKLEQTSHAQPTPVHYKQFFLDSSEYPYNYDKVVVIAPLKINYKRGGVAH